ncbi:MAG: MlaD family protein, partial [Pseudomonadota bacterium]
MDSTRRLALKTGAFVVTAIAIAFVILVVLGREQMWFRRKITVHAAFPDVAGLQEGSLVRLGGRTIGFVSEVRFAGDDWARDPMKALIVSCRVRKDRTDWLRTDSVASISTQGLLGDKLLEIRLGSPGAARVSDGGWIAGKRPAEIDRLIAAVTNDAELAGQVLARVEEASRGLGKEDGEDLGRLLATLNRVATRIEEGPGALHEAVYGSALYEAVNGTVRASERAALAIGEAASEIDRVFGALRVDVPTSDLLVDAALAA